MTVIVSLFTACLVVAIIPGPLAVIAFQGGSDDPKGFVFGLFGQLLGLAIMTNILVVFGSSLAITEAWWFRGASGVALLVLGIKTLTVKRKGKLGQGVTFLGTFVLAFTNPKAVLGFGPPLLLFHGSKLTIDQIILATSALLAAVCISMIFYFGLGRLIARQNIIRLLRTMCGYLLILAGIYFIVLQFTISAAPA